MFCRQCGAQLPEDAAFCVKCGTGVAAVAGAGRPSYGPPSTPPPRDIGEDPLMRMILPIGRSGLAIAAGYLGLFAMLVFPAPLALIFGFLAIVHLKRNPTKHGMGRAIFGLVMGVIFTGVLLYFMLIR